MKLPPIGVRFEPEARAALEKLAKQENRTISNLITTIVTEYLRARKLLK